MTSLPKNSPSLCIPRAFGNITKSRVMDVMKECKFGMVERIDEISRVNDNGDTIKRFFVHFKYWHHGWEAERKRLMSSDSERLKLVYDDPWYWMLKASDPANAYKPRAPAKKIFVERDEIPKAVAVDAAKSPDKSPAKSPAKSPEPLLPANPVSTSHLKIDIGAATPTSGN